MLNKKELMYYKIFIISVVLRLCGHLCPCYNCHHHHLRCRRVMIIIKNIATRGDVGDPGPEGLIGAKGEPGRDGLPGLSPLVATRITTIITTVIFITIRQGRTPKCNHSLKYINMIAMETIYTILNFTIILVNFSIQACQGLLDPRLLNHSSAEITNTKR